MKYKNVKVVGHPRSGSHYLAQLLNINFYHHHDYLTLYAGHSKGHIAWLKQPSTAIIYIYRDNTDTIKSMFKLRDRFGLVAKDIKEFRTKRLSQMHNANIESKAIFKGKIVTVVDRYLSTIHLTIDEYLDEHKSYWSKKASFVVKYDALLEPHFQPTMLAIADFLGSENGEFIRETKRIGWYDASDEEKIFT